MCPNRACNWNPINVGDNYEWVSKFEHDKKHAC